jgi:hypothetical protein
MTRRLLICLSGVLFAGLAGGALARDSVSFSISIGTPAYVQVPSHVYYAPPPPVFYVPAPVHYSAPVVIAAPPVVHLGPPRYASRHYDPRGRHWHKQPKWARGWRH